MYPQDVNFTPDFPRSGELIAGMYKARGGPAVDGVLSVDPVALSYVLRGTGPLKTAGDQTLSADNAVRLLLSKVYEDIPAPDQQNDFFNAAARTVFDAVASGTGDPRVVLDGVVRAASERRLLVWSAHRDEQRLLESTALGGGLPRSPTKHPAVGVYFNAAAPDKLDYYLDYTTSVEPTSCRDGRQRLTVRVNMQSQVPAKVRDLPEYVAPKKALFGRGDILVNASFFAPHDGDVKAITLDGERQVFNTSTLDGRRLLARTIRLKPGQSSVIAVDMVAGRGQTDTADLAGDPRCADHRHRHDQPVCLQIARTSFGYSPVINKALCVMTHESRICIC